VSGRVRAASAAVAAGAVAAGIAGRVARRRSHPAGEGAWDPPPEDLGPIAAEDGTELAVRAAGDPADPILVFAHGFSLDMTTWREQWSDLSSSFRCVLIDHRAHGGSAIPETGDVTVRSMGADLGTVLDAVAPDRPVFLVGHSMGAMAILSLADTRPELFGPRVVGVALVGAAASDLLRGAMGGVTELLRPRRGSLAAAARRVDRLRRAVLAAPRDVPAIVARVTQFGSDAPDELVDHVLRLAERAPSIVWTDGLSQFVRMDLRHALPRVTVPALVAVGDQDRVTPPASAVALAAALPDGHLSVVDGAGHLAMLERPGRLNPELRAFATASFLARGRRRRNEGAA
jgi:pimeloyl-ACP methyl ester carboxylesterase